MRKLSSGKGRFEDPVRLIPRLLTKINTLWLRATYPFAGFGDGVSIHYTCEIQRVQAHRLGIEDSVTLNRDVWLNAPEESDSEGGVIHIGRGCRIGRRSVITGKNRIYLEEDVLLGPNVFNYGPQSRVPRHSDGHLETRHDCRRTHRHRA